MQNWIQFTASTERPQTTHLPRASWCHANKKLHARTTNIVSASPRWGKVKKKGDDVSVSFSKSPAPPQTALLSQRIYHETPFLHVNRRPMDLTADIRSE